MQHDHLRPAQGTAIRNAATRHRSPLFPSRAAHAHLPLLPTVLQHVGASQVDAEGASDGSPQDEETLRQSQDAAELEVGRAQVDCVRNGLEQEPPIIPSDLVARVLRDAVHPGPSHCY